MQYQEPYVRNIWKKNSRSYKYTIDIEKQREYRQESQPP